jgi:hypothetical protein
VANNGIANIPKDNKVRWRLVANNGIANIPKGNKVRRMPLFATNLCLTLLSLGMFAMPFFSCR